MNLRFHNVSSSTHPAIVDSTFNLLFFDATPMKSSKIGLRTKSTNSKGLTMISSDQPVEKPKRFERAAFLASLKPAIDRLKENKKEWAILCEEDSTIQNTNADGLDD